MSLQVFLDQVEESFMCPICQELVFKPVSLPCEHNVCKVRREAYVGEGGGLCERVN